jgi:hypothetical protein
MKDRGMRLSEIRLRGVRLRGISGYVDKCLSDKVSRVEGEE